MVECRVASRPLSALQRRTHVTTDELVDSISSL
jgi:hypothetical protein